MPLLSREQHLATFGGTMNPAGDNEVPPFDFWSYFDAIPASDFESGTTARPAMSRRSIESRPVGTSTSW
ncbi:hypothetical protein [Limnoglobus roseus]|uniref:Uncharacterized protein n=1 Tax=Limnoglobus roseus TaxID=2598579 RepID=A0A5C1AFA9_9BACT|nr:hypothetical protein [Limnoglobus roseus]QEL16412.1 hypothetical protein PX52LOC_03365 [Limnoglobus roseus]